MAHHPVDDCNPDVSDHFQEVLARSQQKNMSRRQVIRGGVGLAALSTIPFLPGCGGGSDAADLDALAKARGNIKKNDTLGFDAIDKSTMDQVVLPAGYTFTVVHATGDALDTSVLPYSNAGTETDDWSRRIGDHHDGMDLFYIGANGRYTNRDTGRALLVVNHESSADAHFFHEKGQTSGGSSGKKFSQFGGWDLGVRPELEVLKEINHHGVSIVELERRNGQWGYKLNSPYNRRVNGQSPMRISGPAADLADIKSFMVTKFDPTGATSRGTLNNCGHGKTPWGTYLGCEENWAAYFFMPKGSTAPDEKTVASRLRYGVARAPLPDSATSGGTQGWHLPDSDTDDDRFARWDVSVRGATPDLDFRNEPNTFGYNVEIDPLGSGMSVKRVAMGRFAHEAAVCSLPQPGKPLAFYMGCDSQNEYIYKFVTAANWDPADIGRGIAAGDKYLDEGKLYAAKFNDDGTGEWIELTIGDARIANYGVYAFANQADVFVNARHAARAVGATPMDRPEWGAVNPKNGEVYFTMTNNSSRTLTNTDAANPRAYNDLTDAGQPRLDSRGNPVGGNPNGHIIRFKESAQTPSLATAFEWDIFLFGAESAANPTTNLSDLSADNDFSSPDGLWFSQATGICWIQTDDGNFTDKSNCMLLAAIPGAVGDGGKITVNNVLNAATGTQETFIGATLGEAQLRRFLVGPKGCEVTGITETPDGKTLFVNIQHPGEGTGALGTAADFNYQSQWPSIEGYGSGKRSRSATIAITREDGGVIGL